MPNTDEVLLEILHAELERYAQENGISFEEALIELRAYVFDDPQPLPPEQHEKPIVAGTDLDLDEDPDYVDDPDAQDVIWKEMQQ